MLTFPPLLELELLEELELLLEEELELLLDELDEEDELLDEELEPLDELAEPPSPPHATSPAAMIPTIMHCNLFIGSPVVVLCYCRFIVVLMIGSPCDSPERGARGPGVVVENSGSN